MYEFRDGKVKEHLGGVQDFLRKRKIETLNELERKSAPDKTPDRNAAAAEKEPTESQKEYRQKKFISKEERKVRNRISFLEKEIEAAETRMKEIEKVLSAPEPSDDVMELTREYLECKRTLDTKTEEWGRLIESIGDI